MNKNIRRCFFLLMLTVFMISGCGTEKKEEATHDTKEPDQSTYALVTKSADNRYNELEGEGFQKVIEASGGTCIVEHPKSTTAREQVRIIEKLIDQNVDSITIAANDDNALDEVIEKARDEGILVTTIDSNVNAEHTSLFINQEEVETIARTLLDAVYDIAEGEGQWAILSASSMAPNQTAWISAMRQLMEDEKYADLDLVEIVYGDDETQLSKDQAISLLQTYQDLKVICAPTTVGCRAAAEAIESQGSTCKLTGLALPSEMAQYMTKDGFCPYFYLLDGEKLGQIAAHAVIGLMADTFTGTEGQTLDAGDLGKYTVQISENESPEIIGSVMLRVSTENIDHWKNIL